MLVNEWETGLRSELTPFPFPWGSFGPGQKLNKAKTIPGEQIWS